MFNPKQTHKTHERKKNEKRQRNEMFMLVRVHSFAKKSKKEQKPNKTP